MEPEPLDRVVSDSMELGIFTFAETALDASGGQLVAEAGFGTSWKRSSWQTRSDSISSA